MTVVSFKDLQKNHWDQQNKRRSPFHPVVKEFAQPKVEIIQQAVNPRGKLLEVGAGNGYFTVYLKEYFNVIALDYSNEMLRQNPHNQLIKGDVKDLKFANNSFDVVFEANTLHHVDNEEKMISEMKRVSQKYVVVVEPNRTNPLMFLFSFFKKVEKRACRYSKRYLQNKLESAGLKIINSFSHGSITPNLTPSYFLPILRHFNKKGRFGMYHVFICVI